MASPRTIRGDVNGTGTVTYELPPGLFQYVQAIRVEVDNTAGGDARPKLDIAEQSGVVIATKRQGEAIPAGDTGSGTWALRLDDEQTLDLPHPIGFYDGIPMGGNPMLAATTTAILSWTFGGAGAGVDLLETAFPSSPEHPTPKDAGLYWISAQVGIAPTVPGAIPANSWWRAFLSVQPADLPPAQFFGQAWTDTRPIAAGSPAVDATVAILDYFHWTVAIPQYLELQVRKNVGWAANVTGTLQVQRVY